MASVYKKKGRSHYLIKFKDYDARTGRGRWKYVSSKTGDKGHAEQIARRLETESDARRQHALRRAHLRELNLLDPVAEDLAEHTARPAAVTTKDPDNAGLRRDPAWIVLEFDKSKRPALWLTEGHLDDFRRVLQGKGNTTDHVERTIRHCYAILEACQFRTIADIEPVRISQYITEAVAEGLSARAINARITSIKAFSHWLFKHQRIRTNPLMAIAKRNQDTDRRRRRRALADEEIERLLTAAHQDEGMFLGLAGPDRSMLYLVAVATGFRVSEIASLTPDSFSLADRRKPTITIEAGYSKHRRTDVQAIGDSYVDIFRDYLADKTPAQPLFDTRALNKKTGRMIARDLKAAGIAPTNSAGHVVDFHSLRHTYISRLGRSGVSGVTAMHLARHSDVNLTMAVYTHLGISDERSALNKLPPLGANTSTKNPRRRRATGTDNAKP